MKQKHKSYIKLGALLLCISVMFVNCQQDDDFYPTEEQNVESNKPAFTVTRINKKQINQNQLVSGVLQRIKRQTITPSGGDLNRLITNATFNVVIDDENAKYLEKSDGSYHSYTFKVVDDESTKKNLVLSVKEDGTYKEILVSYYLTEDDLQDYQLTGLIDFDTKVTYNVINDDTFSIDIYSRELAPTTDSDCIDFVYDGKKCSYNQHTWEQAQNGECCVTNGDCAGTEATQGNLIGINIDQGCISSGYSSNPPSDPGPGPGDSGDDGSGGTGGTGEGNDDYDPTDPDMHGNGADGDDDPIFAPDVDETPPNPCTSGLGNLINKSIANQATPKTVKDNLNYLKNNLNQNKEMMYFMSPTTTAETEFVENYEESLPNEDEVNVAFGTNAKCIIMHCHYSTANHLSVFSLADIYQIYTSIIAGNIFSPSTFTSIVVTAHGTTYAIKISDTQAFLTWGNTFFTGWDLPLPPENNPLVKAREDDYELYVTKKQTNNKNEYGIASFFSNNSLGLELYKADNTFSNWSKITPNANGTTTATPCQ